MLPKEIPGALGLICSRVSRRRFGGWGELVAPHPPCSGRGPAGTALGAFRGRVTSDVLVRQSGDRPLCFLTTARSAVGMDRGRHWGGHGALLLSSCPRSSSLGRGME